MRNLKDIILERLVLSKNKSSDIPWEDFCEALANYLPRKNAKSNTIFVKNTNIKSLVNDLFVWDTVESFICNHCKNLKSLEGAPKKCINFICTFCDSLTNLIGAPEYVDTEFKCDYCRNLSSLEGITWKSVHHFSCKGTSIHLTARESIHSGSGSIF